MTKYVIRIYHTSYGCETGCCGHRIEVSDSEGSCVFEKFQFSHPDKADNDIELRAWALEIIKESVELNYPACLASLNETSLDVTEIRGILECSW